MSLRDAFAGIKAAQDEPEPQPVEVKIERAPAPVEVMMPARTVLQGKVEKVVKSRDPEFSPYNVYLRKETRKRALRKWEDETGKDFSELMQELLVRYLDG